MKRIWTLLLVLFVLAAPAAFAAAEPSAGPEPSVDPDRATAEGVKHTERWEQTYGPHELWDYHTNALYAAAFGTVAGGWNPSWLPVEPPDDVLSYTDAVTVAEGLLSAHDERLTLEYLGTLTVASSFIVTDTPGLYSSSARGVWDVEFWNACGDAMKRVGYVYVDGETGTSPLLVISVDQADPYDEAGLVVIENPAL